MSTNGRTDWRMSPDLRDPGMRLTVPDETVDRIARRILGLLDERRPERDDGWLNVAQAAEYIAAPTSRIYDLRRQGLTTYKDGSRLLFRRSDLDAWIKEAD